MPVAPNLWLNLEKNAGNPASVYSVSDDSEGSLKFPYRFWTPFSPVANPRQFPNALRLRFNECREQALALIQPRANVLCDTGKYDFSIFTLAGKLRKLKA